MKESGFSNTELFRPAQLGELRLANSIVMAPLTRCMADENLVPTQLMAEYYERRAGAGLIISEATIIRPNGIGYPNTPGIYSEDQVRGWRSVTERVKRRGGKMVLQLWHVGRVSHSSYLDGELPVAPSAVGLEGRVPRTENLQYETPRALATEEIAQYVESYAQAAANAMAAGFDGVEIHGANGYLIDQFLHADTNRREDQYGGSIENRARFALEVADAVLAKVPAGRVGIRLSPAGHFNGIETQAIDVEVGVHLLSELEKRKLAYVHAGIFDDSATFPLLGGSVTEYLRKHYKGNLIGNGSYDPESALIAIREGRFDVIAFGRPFIANHDFVERLAEGRELAAYDESMLATLY